MKMKSGKKEVFLTAAIMAVVAVVIILIMMFQRKVDSTVVEDGAYNYFGKKKVEYQGNVNLRYQDGRAVLKDDNGVHELDSTPLYAGDNRIVIPQAYIWYDLSTGKICRVEHFGEIKNESNSIRLEDGSLMRQDAGGFLYDGVDTYIFLETVELSAGEDSVTLPAMSYVVAKYNDTIQYYAKGADDSVVLDIKGKTCQAAFGKGDRMDLGTDILYRANGTWQLMIVDPQLLERME